MQFYLFATLKLQISYARSHKLLDMAVLDISKYNILVAIF